LKLIIGQEGGQLLAEKPIVVDRFNELLLSDQLSNDVVRSAIIGKVPLSSLIVGWSSSMPELQAVCQRLLFRRHLVL
jgi:hypothetical protein